MGSEEQTQEISKVDVGEWSPIIFTIWKQFRGMEHEIYFSSGYLTWTFGSTDTMDATTQSSMLKLMKNLLRAQVSGWV